MLSEGEKDIINKLERTKVNITGKLYNFEAGEILCLINNLQKENEKKDKQIDLMAEFIKNNMSEKKIINEICIKGKCNNEECHEDDLKDCIKQYFEKQAKEKGE